MHTPKTENPISVLVTSAAGRTGTPVVRQLLEKGHRVRAFVRVDDARSRALADAGADVFAGNLADPRDVRAALNGISRAYFCPPTSHNGLHYAGVFALAARESGVEHVVQMSQWLSHETHPSLYTREICLADRIVPEISGATQTLINVGWFAANYFFVLRPAAQLGVFPMPLGGGRNAPPSNDDIARVVVGALERPGLHAGRSYRPTGPELLTPEEIVEHIGAALGRRVRYRPVSQRMLLKSLRAEGWPVGMQTQFVHYLEEYRRDAFAIGAPTDAVRTVAGVEPEDFATIARREVARDPWARRTLGRGLSTIGNMARALATRPIDPLETERERDHALIKRGELAPDSQVWRATHDGGAPPSVVGTVGAA